MTQPYYADESVTLYHGDCLDVLAALPDASVDAVVTDPPYGLEFMGREWDSFKPAAAHAQARTRRAAEVTPTGQAHSTSAGPYLAAGVNAYAAGAPFQAWCQLWAAECLRVLKPGGHLLAFGGTRTWHRLTCAIEDAGFEIRDSIAWLYGSGFPKSLDVSKAIDRAAGAERTEIIGRNPGYRPNSGNGTGMYEGQAEGRGTFVLPNLTAPATDDARTWQGWGTALKPAFEPVVVARRPLSGTVASNVLQHGTGALNIDGCRVGDDATIRPASQPFSQGGVRNDNGRPAPNRRAVSGSASGRWPSNVVLDDTQAARLDAESGTLTSGDVAGSTRHTDGGNGSTHGRMAGAIGASYADSGGASRFFPTFRYEAKAPTLERPVSFRQPCECEDAWPTTPHARATAATTEVAGSSTSRSGKPPTGDPSPTDIRSTTLTATSGTTTRATSSRSPRSNTSASTPDASSATESGGSPAASATSSSPSALPTGTSAPKGGRSTAAAGRVTLPAWSAISVCGSCGQPARREAHATVKPLDLMRWLVRLVTPPGGLVLDPFAGSGTTAEACILEGFRCVAVEREADYLPLIVQRLSKPLQPGLGLDFGDAS